MQLSVDDAEVGDVRIRDSKATPERLQRCVRRSKMHVVWVTQPAVILSLEGLHDDTHRLRWRERYRDGRVGYGECNP
jgi:hypothetical protein